jgi:translation initiation factor 2A
MDSESGKQQGDAGGSVDAGRVLPRHVVCFWTKTGLEVAAVNVDPYSADCTAVLETLETFGPSGGTFGFSPDGSLFAVAESACVRVFCVEPWNQGFVIDEPNVQLVQFSPLSRFMVTFRRVPPNGDVEDNVKVWRLPDPSSVDVIPETVMSFKLRTKDIWPVLQWNSDESILAHRTPSSVDFLDGGLRTIEVRHSLKVTGLLAAEFSGNTEVSLLAVALKGNPSVVKVFRYPHFAESHVVCSRVCFKAEGFRLLFSPSSSGLLILTHTEVDETNKNYYGSNNLFFMGFPKEGPVSTVVPFEKEGPVHDMQWSPNGSEFVVIQGYMPAKALCFTVKCEPYFDFGSAPRNTVSWSPHGRVLALGGFGNLPGDVDFWDRDRNKFKKLGFARAQHPVDVGWSPDGFLFWTSTVHPRLRVDNRFCIYSISGRKVLDRSFAELYRAVWRPALPGVFPSRPPTGALRKEGKEIMEASEKASQAVAAPYRPPALRGATAEAQPTSSFVHREVEKPKKLTANANQSKAAPAAGPVGVQQRYVPGWTAPSKR